MAVGRSGAVVAGPQVRWARVGRGKSSRNRLGSHQVRVKSPRRAQNATAWRPAVLVRVSEMVIKGVRAGVRHRVARPVRLAARSSSANEVFQSLRTGLV